MDGSGVGTVVLLNNTNTVHIFVFTLDYSQQMLYWMNSSDSCYYTDHIESSKVDGSGRRIAYGPSGNSNRCYYGYYHRTQAIDFFGGAIYSYSRYSIIFKTEVGNVLNITNRFSYVSNYMCGSSYMYSGMKVISRERQPQGICIMHCWHGSLRMHNNNIMPTIINNYTLYRCKPLCHQQWWLCSPLSA